MIANPLSRLGRRDRRVLLRGGAAILAIIALGRGTPAARRWTFEARANADQLVAEAGRAMGSVAATERTRDSLAARNGRFLALAPRLLDGDTPASAGGALASVVSGAAADAGMKVGSIDVRADSAQRQTFARVSVRADLTGDLHGIVSLLESLEGDALLLAVRQLAITQPDAQAPADRAEALRVELTVEGLALMRRSRGGGR